MTAQQHPLFVSPCRPCRLLTPPGQPARSLVARPEGPRLQTGTWMRVYVGVASAAKNVDRGSLSRRAQLRFVLPFWQAGADDWA